MNCQDTGEDEFVINEPFAGCPRNGLIVWIGFICKFEIDRHADIRIKIDGARVGIEIIGYGYAIGNFDAAVERFIVIPFANSR